MRSRTRSCSSAWRASTTSTAPAWPGARGHRRPWAVAEMETTDMRTIDRAAEAPADAPIQFSRGVPPPEAIPAAELRAHTEAVLAASPDALFQYAPLGGYRGDEALLEQLGAFLAVDPEHLFVGNGSLQVLDLLARHLLGPAGGTVLVEAP